MVGKNNFNEWNLKLIPFKPWIDICTGHTQTIIAHLIKSKLINFQLQTELVHLRDNDQIPIHYHIINKSKYMITLFHGLASDHKADYMQRTAIIANKLGMSVCLVDHRGTLMGQGLNTNIYHSGKWEDADDVFIFLKNKYPEKIHIFIGFSMSGSILLNLVTSENKMHGLPNYIIAVNPPIDLLKASLALGNGFNKIYDFRFYRKLKKLVNDFDKNLSWPIYLKTIDFDNQITAKLGGFVDGLDYYKKSSTFYKLDNLKTKTFILSSKDDPFIPVDSFLNLNKQELLHLTITDSGGHLGYYHKNKLEFFNHRWLDHYLTQVFSTICSHELI